MLDPVLTFNGLQQGNLQQYIPVEQRQAAR